MDVLDELKKLHSEFSVYEKNKIPLCAAETSISDFVKQAYKSSMDTQYIMGHLQYNKTGDFIGSEYVYKLFNLISVQCKLLFGTDYSDARTLSGINCFTTLMLSLSDKKRKKALITTPEQGGHASYTKILASLGILFSEIPYEYSQYQIDYKRTNKLLASNKYDYIIFCQSDLLQPPDISKLAIPKRTLLIYDGTQTLGLIASGFLKNPILQNKSTVLIGGTHKTIAGPTCGLILTNNKKVINKIDNRITPEYLRNIQPNNVLALLLALIEHEKFGRSYIGQTIFTANLLASHLEKRGFHLAKIDDAYTKTHQIFIVSTEAEAKILYTNCLSYNVTLNIKHKPLFNGWGTRIGVQEIAKYNWTESDIACLADLIYALSKTIVNQDEIKALISRLLMIKNGKNFLEDYFIE